MVEWMKMKVGVQVGLGPGHIVLEGDPAPPPYRGTAPHIFAPYLLWPNGWVNQDGTWHGGGSESKPHCATWGAPKKGGRGPHFSANFHCGQTAGWIKMPLGIVVSVQATLC